MALSITQLASASFEKVLSKKPTNQWAENALLREMEKQGMIKRVAFGTKLQEPLDYRRNPDAAFLSTDLQPLSLTKTEVLTAAEYTEGQLIVPITVAEADEAKNPSENQKVDFVAALLENMVTSHDELIEQGLFATSTNGFLGLQTLVPDSGQATVGGIDASVEAWWRNHSATYASAGTNIQAQLTKAFNEAAKGTGGGAPTLLVSDGDSQAIYEGTLQANQRYIDTEDGNAGFKTLAFKNARYVFSQHGGTRIYGLSKMNFQLQVCKDAYRKKSDWIPLQNANGKTMRVYTMLQATTKNKSRNFVLTQV